jgi:adenosylcobinamide-GDP ribazoletransferase
MASGDKFFDPSGPSASFVKEAASKTLAALRFYSRLPLPRLPFEREPFAMPTPELLARYSAVAGAIIGACGAIVLILAHALGLPRLPAAALAVSALVVVAGALHEDGLADTADGFGGGRTIERKLEIMRDSRIGAFGAAALALSLILRVAALASLAGAGLASAAAALILAGAVSRSCGLIPLVLLDPARDDGAGAVAGRVEGGAFFVGGLVALAFLVVTGLFAIGLGRAILAGLLAAAAAFAMTAIARRQIGGQTGDVAGAAQQLAEIACLYGLLIGGGVA